MIRQRLKNYLQAEGKPMLLAFASAIVICLAFYSYLQNWGIPMTMARSQFNRGLRLFQAEQYLEARSAFVSAQSFHHTAEAEWYLQQIKQETQSPNEILDKDVNLIYRIDDSAN